MAVLAPNLGQDVIPYVHAIADDLLGRGSATDSFFSGDYPIHAIQISGIQYTLRRTLMGRLSPTGDGRFQFTVESLAPDIAGEGPSASEAIIRWKSLIHSLVQRLLATRPFERDANEHNRWRTFESAIDMSALRRSTPTRMRQLGRVEFLKDSYPRAIRWIGGNRDHVSLDQMPAEFASYKPGQWVEAFCERDPVVGRLLRVTYIERIPAVRMMSFNEQQQYWDSLPTDDALPESELDWTEHPEA